MVEQANKCELSASITSAISFKSCIVESNFDPCMYFNMNVGAFLECYGGVGHGE
jgi:hypothetical protein